MPKRNLTFQPLSVEELTALVALVDHGGVSAAASALDESQPSISRRLAVFKELAEPLLRKRGKELVLTDKGFSLLPEIRKLLRQLDGLKGRILDRFQTQRLLRLGAGSFAAEQYLPAAVADFGRRMPGWQIEVLALRGRQRIIETAQGSLDLAIVTHTSRQVDEIVAATFGKSTRLTTQTLATHRIVAAAATDSAVGEEMAQLAANRAVSMQRLAGWPLVGLDADSGIRRQLEQRAAEKHVALEFASAGLGWHAAKQFAKNGLGVALLPAAILRREDHQTLTVRPLPSDVAIHDSLIFTEREIAKSEQSEYEHAVYVLVESLASAAQRVSRGAASIGP